MLFLCSTITKFLTPKKKEGSFLTKFKKCEDFQSHGQASRNQDIKSVSFPSPKRTYEAQELQEHPKILQKVLRKKVRSQVRRVHQQAGREISLEISIRKPDKGCGNPDINLNREL